MSFLTGYVKHPLSLIRLTETTETAQVISEGLTISKVHDHTLTLGNKAEYASDVSSRGYDVIDSGIQYIKKEIEDMR